MTFNSAKIQHQNHVFANEIAAHINGAKAVSADALSACGIAGPSAVQLAKMIHAGVGGAVVIGQLRQMGFSGEDSVALAAAFATAGAH